MGRKKFMKYDYFQVNETKNLEEYGSNIPDLLQLHNIKKPNTIMYVGTRDDISDIRDTEWLAKHIKSVSEIIKFDFKHSDFHFVADNSYYEGIILRLDQNNGIAERRGDKVFA